MADMSGGTALGMSIEAAMDSGITKVVSTMQGTMASYALAEALQSIGV